MLFKVEDLLMIAYGKMGSLEDYVITIIIHNPVENKKGRISWLFMAWIIDSELKKY